MHFPATPFRPSPRGMVKVALWVSGSVRRSGVVASRRRDSRVTVRQSGVPENERSPCTSLSAVDLCDTSRAP